VLREDNRAIVRAASKASKAADYILGLLPQDECPTAMTTADDAQEAA
jgi:antirestriction protein ArdC